MEDLTLYTAYFCNGSSYYLNKLERYKNGSPYLFNVYAFFFGIFWFMYRKLYVEGLIILIVIVVESLLESFITTGFSETTGKTIGYAINIVMAIMVSMLANVLYLRKAQREVEKAKLLNLDEDNLLKYLQQKGGVSYWFLVLAIVVLVCVFWYFFRLNNKH